MRPWPFTLAVALALPLAGCDRALVNGAQRWYLVGPEAAPDLQPGFGVGIVEERLLDGARLGRTRAGRFLPMARLLPAEPARALGVDGRPPIAWVIDRQAPVFPGPDDGEPPLSTRGPLDRVALDEGAAPPAGWLRAAGGFMKTSQLRAPRPAPRPVEAGPAERWIDIDTQTETLGVYDGDVPLFTTLVSTGTGAPGWRYQTPRGVHRISYKVPAATMDGDDKSAPPYSFEDVPWVQYFHKDVALHGAYWHQRFGHPVSHGCVNLTPADAERVYALTRATTPAYPGTIVRVR